MSGYSITEKWETDGFVSQWVYVVVGPDGTEHGSYTDKTIAAEQVRDLEAASKSAPVAGPVARRTSGYIVTVTDAVTGDIRVCESYSGTQLVSAEEFWLERVTRAYRESQSVTVTCKRAPAGKVIHTATVNKVR